MAKAATFSTDPKAAREVEVEILPPSNNASAAAAAARQSGAQDPPGTGLSRILSFVLDDLFRVPGTNLRFGLDPIVGLLPGLGDIASSTGASLILITAAAHGVPKLILARMSLHILVNAILGAVPGVGDAFSFWFKSNARNHALLLKHMGKQGEITKGDWIFVGGLLAVIALTVFLVIFALAGLLGSSARYWFGTGS